MVDPYPLAWPEGRQRWQGWREIAKFKVSEAQAVAELHEQLEALGADDVVISTNRKPYSRSQANPDDPGAAVYFMRKGRETVIACDKFNRLEHNIRAIGLTIKGLRDAERWGTEVTEAAFVGYSALPASIVTPPPSQPRPWHEVLEVSPTASLETIDAAYRSLARKAHPDQGGSAEAFAELSRALREAKKERP